MFRMLSRRVALAIAAVLTLGTGAAVFALSQAGGLQPAAHAAAVSAAAGRAATHGLNDSSSGSRVRGALAASACPTKAGPMPASISMTAKSTPPYFTQDCYYAPAGQAFTLTISNSVFDTGDKLPTQVRVIISPSQHPAMWEDPARPGMSYGSTENAVFVGTTVTAPDSKAFTVPALAAGTYLIQNMEEAGVEDTVTLIVQ